MPIRVIIADDHPVYRDGIVQALMRADDLELVGMCEDGDTTVAQMDRHQPDVVLLDLRMEGATASEVIAAGGDRTRVLVLSASTEPKDVTAVLDAGAAGYITKETSSDAILAAIRRAAAGETVVGHEVQQALVTALRTRRALESHALTERETQCLELLADGFSVPAIAERLILSPSTVKTHLRSLYEKLGVSDRAAAVAEGMRRGLVT